MQITRLQRGPPRDQAGGLESLLKRGPGPGVQVVLPVTLPTPKPSRHGNSDSDSDKDRERRTSAESDTDADACNIPRLGAYFLYSFVKGLGGVAGLNA